ncbi:MAG: hypothetical protein AAF842_01065 [Planctomycetota bacterium]
MTVTPGVDVGAILSLVITLGLSVGALFVAFGWYGRRLSDHLHCRGCGFDLHGSSDEQGEPPASCPECGRSFREGKGTRRGLRRVRPALLGVGVFVLMLGVGALGLQAYAGSRNLNLNPYKPVWLLRYEAGQHGTTTSVAALDELITRHHAARLSQPAIHLLVADGMQLQADMTAAWEPRWGEIVEFAREQGQVADADWERYIKTAVVSSLSLDVRDRVMIGDPIYHWVRSSRPRLSDSSRRWHISREDRGFAIDGIEDTDKPGGRSSSGGSLGGRHGGGASGRGEPFQHELWGDLEPQRYEATRGLSIEVSEMVPGSWEKQGTPFLVFDHDLSDTFELTDEPTAVPVVDDALRDQVHQSLTEEGFKVRSGERWGYISGSIELKQPPVGLAFRVYLRDSQGREVELGTINEGPNDQTSYHVSGEKPDWGDWTEDSGDVVLRPDEAAAKQSNDVFEYWDEEVLLVGVPIKLPEPAHDEGRAVSP